MPDQFLVQYCFQTTYAYVFLKYGLKVPSDEPGRVRVAPAAEDLGWALGSMFVEANSAAFQLEFDQQPNDVFEASTIALGALFGITLFCCLGMAA